MQYHLDALYAELEKDGITVIQYPFEKIKSVALEDERVIGIDLVSIKTKTEEYTVLIHEKGHFDAGAFYTPENYFALAEQAEYRADRAAILKNIPLGELRRCFAGGTVDLWELAEHFSVTEAYIKQAVYFYKEVLGVRF